MIFTVDCVKRTKFAKKEKMVDPNKQVYPKFYSFGEIQRMQICSDFEEYSLKSAVFRLVILGNIMTPRSKREAMPVRSHLYTTTG